MYLSITILAVSLVAGFVGIAIGVGVEVRRNRRYQVWQRFHNAELKFRRCGVGEV